MEEASEEWHKSSVQHNWYHEKQGRKYPTYQNELVEKAIQRRPFLLIHVHPKYRPAQQGSAHIDSIEELKEVVRGLELVWINSQRANYRDNQKQHIKPDNRR
jgi:hypothetical protein